MGNISVGQKIVLVLLGISLFFILLEAGLRMCGGAILFFQDQRNKVSFKKKGEYRIVCFGESTTVWGDDNSWPSQLERILNEKNQKIKYRVINKGRHAIQTSYILSILEESIEKYKPDMIITMMGINDGDNNIPYENKEESKKSFLTHFKVYKLVEIISLHIKDKFGKYRFDLETQTPLNDIGATKIPLEEINFNTDKNRVNETIRNGDKIIYLDNMAGVDEGNEIARDKEKEDLNDENSENIPESDNEYIQKGTFHMDYKEYAEAEKMFHKAADINPDNENVYMSLAWCYREERRYEEALVMLEKAKTINPKSSWLFVELGNLYHDQGRFKEAEDYYKTALSIEPNNDNIYVDLGGCYGEEGRHIEAKEMFKKASQLNTKNINAYMYLGICYREHKKYKEAEEIFKKILEEDTGNYRVYLELGTTYREQGKNIEQEQVLKKAIEKDSTNDAAYVELGWCYGDNERYSEAEEMFKKAIEINPRNSVPYIELGDYYKIQGKFKEIEELTKKAEKLIDNDDRFYGYLAVSYLTNGEYALAEKYFQKATDIRMKYHPHMTLFNYRKLREKVTTKGIKLVCVQYPMRNIEPLKKIFDTTEGVIFIDNEMIFKQAVEHDKFEDYFEDSFAGDFGHCTPKGNMLLAENVARVISEEVFR